MISFELVLVVNAGGGGGGLDLTGLTFCRDFGDGLGEWIFFPLVEGVLAQLW